MNYASKYKSAIWMLSLPLAAGALVLMPQAASAQPAAPAAGAAAPPSTGDIEEAKTYFGVGAQAYERGEFIAAIAAFEEAQKRVPKPAVLFSIAQGHRRQYYIDKRPEHLLGATKQYRAYLTQAPTGPRAADAAQYLAELGVAEERLTSSGVSLKDLAALKQPTRVSVNASSAAGATVQIDNKPPVEAPLIAEVEPGKHHVVVSAPGYLPEARDVMAVANSFVAVDMSLRESPAKLQVDGDVGARVEVDGRLVGTLPLSTPVIVPPGTHLIAVSAPGSDPYVRELEFTRDESKRLKVQLATSAKRKVSNGLFVGAAAAGVATVVFAGLSLSKESSAKDLEGQRSSRPLTTTELNDYQDAKAARGTFTTAAIITGAGAVVLGGTALVLRVFDDPARNAPSIQSDQKTRPDRRDGREPLEVGLAPWLGPNQTGATVFGRF
jgi:hypothetical protein